MKKILFISLLGLANLLSIYAEEKSAISQDTIQSKYLNEVIISSSTKETNSLNTLPGSVSFITPQMIEGQKILNIKDLSTIIPNFFVADYGSKFSVPVYIRGIGERSTGQSIGMYVDNMPYLDKSVFDFEFMDISQIEVLRGPQGTLYGRNAMSGIVNIVTRSPLDSQYGKIALTAGNYGLFRAKAAASELLTKNTGISISGYYDGNNGYFTNQFDDKQADKLKSAGARVRFDWKLNPHWTAQLMANYDISDQGAFPYGKYENGAISKPNYNSPGSYERQVAGSNLNLNYKNDRIIFNSNTAFQYFDDDMKMDVDNTPRDIFRLNQLQNEKSWTEELTIKSNTKNNYQWSFGLFGFYTNLKTDVTTTMGSSGIETILQSSFDKIHENAPKAPIMTVKDTEIPIPAALKTPTYGGAIFHQSTYNNLFIEGLSLTAGIRLDYEKAQLKYNTHMDMNLAMKMETRPGTFIELPDSLLSTAIQGDLSTKFTEVLPKIALKYEFDASHYVYATVSNGYKTGGYNIQNFADIMQGEVRKKYDKNYQTAPVDSLVAYKPEYSWNYEIGFKGELVKDFLYAEIAGFFIDVRDIQITDFVESGQGRILKNAGKARSVGFDLGLTALLTDEFRVSANYGFTQATFKDYTIGTGDNKTDYSGNHVPFAPQNTLSVSAVYNKRFTNKWIDRFNIQAQYNAAGKIYWTEANDVAQDFYGLLNLRAGINKGIFGVNVWANNVLNTKYTAFYFESMNQQLAQAGKPFTFGVEATISF
ncbi:MAG: TonB-dependent receptor [Candidatus Symbiothrix sp.]|nr:TonB-dependent receptor [Candidatus Symbiothrix sp.]